MQPPTPPPNLRALLRSRLQGAERIAVLAVGSSLRGDDAAGLLVAEQLREASPKDSPLGIFVGETAPENLTGAIKRYNPTHMVIVDAADLQKPPGEAAFLEVAELSQHASFCTHNLPMEVLVRYLLSTIHCDVFVIGIQPASLDFGRDPSREIVASAHAVAADILAAVKAR